MQIIEKIKQFTKPLQGRLLPSNVIAFAFYFVGLHLLVSVFYSEIELLIKSTFIEGRLDVFKGKSSWQLDTLCLLSVGILGYRIWEKAQKGYVFSDITLYVLWTFFIIYGRYINSPAWRIERLSIFNDVSYIDIFVWLAKTGWLLIFFISYLNKLEAKENSNFSSNFAAASFYVMCISLFTVSVFFDFLIFESLFLNINLYLFLKNSKKIEDWGYFLVAIVIIIVAFLMFYQREPIDFFNYYALHLSMLLSIGIIWFSGVKAIKTSTSNYFVEDAPTDNDSIGRKVFAQNLVEQLHSQTFTEAFTVGILGEWGAGKSQFMKYMRKELDKKSDVIYLDFSPWLQSHNTKLVVIQHFFEALAEKYKPYSSALSKQLNSYQHKLFEVVPATGGIGMIWKAAKDLLNDWLTNDIDSEKINEALKVINKKTVVFIDDLDRLHADEVLDILKVMRTAANFWNTVYIVGADKPRVIELLKSKHSDEKFLDKFIQLEVHLTPMKATFLWNVFINFCEQSAETKGILEYRYEGHLIKLFEKYITNVREVKKIYNNILFDLKCLGVNIDINLYDFILLSIIKYKSIKKYNELYFLGIQNFAYDIFDDIIVKLQTNFYPKRNFALNNSIYFDRYFLFETDSVYTNLAYLGQYQELKLFVNYFEKIKNITDFKNLIKVLASHYTNERITIKDKPFRDSLAKEINLILDNNSYLVERLGELLKDCFLENYEDLFISHLINILGLRYEKFIPIEFCIFELNGGFGVNVLFSKYRNSDIADWADFSVYNLLPLLKRAYLENEAEKEYFEFVNILYRNYGTSHRASKSTIPFHFEKMDKSKFVKLK